MSLSEGMSSLSNGKGGVVLWDSEVSWGPSSAPIKATQGSDAEADAEAEANAAAQHGEGEGGASARVGSVDAASSMESNAESNADQDVGGTNERGRK